MPVHEHVPSPVIELLVNRLQAAMQIIAALVLTDEEGEAFCKDPNFDSRPDPQWIQSMREDLLGDYRPELIAAIRKTGFLTNTDPGFIFPSLTAGPQDTFNLDRAYAHLDQMLVSYSRGEGDEVDSNNYQAEWSRRLRDAGFSFEIADWVMRCEGNVRACVAGLDRLCTNRPSRTAERVSK